MGQLTVADRGEARWILLEGELDQSDVLEIKKAFDAAIRAAAGDVVLDLGRVTFLSTLGIGLIASAQDTVEEAGRVLRLANVPEFIDRAFRTMDLDELFERV